MSNLTELLTKPSIIKTLAEKYDYRFIQKCHCNDTLTMKYCRGSLKHNNKFELAWLVRKGVFNVKLNGNLIKVGCPVEKAEKYLADLHSENPSPNITNPAKQVHRFSAM